MFDATGKLPPGVVKGNFQWVGNYKECISTSLIPGVNDSRRGFGSHYCPIAIEATEVIPTEVCISSRLHFCRAGSNEVEILC